MVTSVLSIHTFSSFPAQMCDGQCSYPDMNFFSIRFKVSPPRNPDTKLTPFKAL